MIAKYLRMSASVLTAMTLAIGGPGSLWADGKRYDPPTNTPIKHVVVLFQENISFDHYFGTYPYATNPDRRAGISCRTPTRPAQTIF